MLIANRAISATQSLQTEVGSKSKYYTIHSGILTTTNVGGRYFFCAPPHSVQNDGGWTSFVSLDTLITCVATDASAQTVLVVFAPFHN